MGYTSLGLEENVRLHLLASRGVPFDEAYPLGEEPSGISREELHHRFQAAIAEKEKSRARGMAWDFPSD